jgi:hypothetical protein
MFSMATAQQSDGGRDLESEFTVGKLVRVRAFAEGRLSSTPLSPTSRLSEWILSDESFLGNLSSDAESLSP